MTTLRMKLYGGRNYVTPLLTNVEIIGPRVGTMTCLECDGDPQGYAAAFPSELGVQTWIDCKGRGWIYGNV
jgi:hypothetical protein